MSLRSKPAKKSKPSLQERIGADNFETVRELRLQVSSLERRLQKARSKEDIVVDAVEAVLRDKLPVLRAPAKPKRQTTPKDLEEVAVLHLSDHQLGKVTSTFDTTIAEERVMQCVEKTALITRMRRQHARITEIHVYLGGDMVEGEDIFPGQAHEIEASVFDQACLIGPRIYSTMLMGLLEEFERVEVYAVPGNHGRNSFHAAKRTNWDQVLYHSLRSWFGDRLGERLSFKIAERFWLVDTIYGHGNLLVHGHQIRGGFAGFPWYGAAKKAWGWIDSIKEPWENLWFGHFHTPAMMTLGLRRAYANGTIESDNEYAREELAACGTPSQRLAFFDKKRGMIADHLLELD